MKRLKIMKAYAVLWLFIYFLIISNFEAMKTFFFATLTFNLAVLTVLTIGIIVIMSSSVRLVMLAGTFGILAYKKENLTFYLQGIEKIMPANIAHMFNSRAEKGVLLFTSEESRAVVEWIDEKFANQSRYINYFIGTCLMIGLLGTFTGLLVAIDQMGKIILSLSGDIDLGQVIRSFAGPLGGMATGFGSSLFGVIAAIILGLMGYILNKNQETLIEGVEDWLKGRIIDSVGTSGSAVATVSDDANESLPLHRSSFIDVFIDNISSLSKEMAKIAQTNERLHSITIASVQQARDEHETNYDLFSSMNQSLNNIDTKIDTQLRLLENGTNDELQTSLSSLSKQMKEEMVLLGSIEKLNKVQIVDGRKQDTSSKELFEKQKEILELLVGKNEESLDELKRISSISTSAGEFTVQSETPQGNKPKGFFSKFFG